MDILLPEQPVHRRIHSGIVLHILNHDVLMLQEPRQPTGRIDLEADILQHVDGGLDARRAPLIRIVELIRA